MTNQTIPVRKGEQIDIQTIENHLKEHIPGLRGHANVAQFPSGASNLTYLIRFEDREVVLRRPPFGTKAKSAHDMGREVRILTGLQNVYPYVPKVLTFCDDDSVIGCEFYVMEPIKGLILRGDRVSDLPVPPEQYPLLCRHLIDRLIELHSVDYRNTALADLGRPEGYARRQIEGWSKRYVKARTSDAPAYANIMAWLQNQTLPDASSCVVHNDYRFDNVILAPDDPLKIIGVLDWELATVGDPLMDLGNTLAYWIEPDDPEPLHMLRQQPTHLPGMMTRREVLDYYGTRTGLNTEHFDVYLVFGLFRLVVIAQQIYYRFYHGQTRDPRFGKFIDFIQFAEAHLERMIENPSY
jgi:aminoglycoside phosphotransferase (APT) family kinase protein